MKGTLIFDLDDTLIPSSALYEQALRAIGLSDDDASYLQARALVKSRLPSLHVVARNRLLYLKAWLESQGRLNPSELLKLMGNYEDALCKALRDWDGLDETQRLLTQLRKDYSIGLLTNENTRTQLLKLSVLDPQGALFDAVVTSEEVGVEKPDPRIFAEAESRLSLKKPPIAPITMIGDSWEADLAPALNRGWNAILLTQFLQPKYLEAQKQRIPGEKGVSVVDSLAALTYKLKDE